MSCLVAGRCQALFHVGEVHGQPVYQRPEIAMSTTYQVNGGVAVITLNNPPVNGLGHSTRSGIFEGLQQAQADARNALRQRSQARHQNGPGFLRAQITPGPNAMVGVEVMRQLGDQLGRDADGAGIAIARRDAVNDPILAQQAIEKGGATLDAPRERGLLAQVRSPLARCQRDHILDGQTLAVKDHRLGAVSVLIRHVVQHEASPPPAARKKRN